MYKKRYKAGLVDGANSPALSALSISRSTAQTFNGTPDPRTTFFCIFNVYACFLFRFWKLSTFPFCISPLSISQSGAQTLNGTVGRRRAFVEKMFRGILSAACPDCHLLTCSKRNAKIQLEEMGREGFER